MSNKILAAEDSPTQAAVLRAHLEEAGFDVTLAGNGAEALTLLEGEAFDLVLSDVVMPDVDGYELCRQVKDRFPKVPVVLLTSMNDPLDVVNALAAGADNFLRKPYQPGELVHRVRNMLHNKEMRDSGRTQMGLELFFLGRRFMINADREQILDLLVSTFEDLVEVNQRLRSREEELAHAHEELSVRLDETEVERDRLDTVLAAIPGPVGVFDQEGRIVKANDQLVQLAGQPLPEGQLVWDAVRFTDASGQSLSREQRTLHHSLCAGESSVMGTAFDLFIQRPDGEQIPVVARTQPIRDRSGKVAGAVGTLEDLRELREHDPLTALPGRNVVVETLRTVCQTGPRADRHAGVVVVSVDRYDRLRGSLGGEVDDVVAAMAAKLRQQLGTREIAKRTDSPLPAYLGDSEFALVLPDVESETDAIVVAQLLVSTMAGPVLAGGMELGLTVSAAVGMCTSTTDPPLLVATVAAAARKAGSEGGGRVASSDPALQARVVDFLRREQDLRVAITTDQLVPYYQPQIDVRDGRPIAVEALVRWQHPERGLLGAAEVIPLAMESGLIADVSWSVLEQSCSQVAEWRRTMPGAEHLVLSVNFAAEQLAEPAMSERVEHVLTTCGLDPRALVVEITEGSVMDDPAAASRQLNALKALGITVAVDDFGTGYSSLLQLRRLPIDVLKIDRQFVAGMVDDPADGAIVAGTIRLARALGLGMVAEGVESTDQLVQLRILGCDHAQGYLWAKPMGADELSQWWSQQRTAPLFDDRTDASLLEIDDRQDEAVSYLIHELRSPLAAVMLYTGLLARKPDDVDALATAIMRSATELAGRLTALAESADVLRGDFAINPEPTDVVDLVRGLVADLSAQMAPHPVNMTVDGPVEAEVDRLGLHQAISNLLTNAAKFSPGETPIDVRLATRESLVLISVRDHGPGIPEHRRTELFRRFSRLGSTHKGMGIGLFLARSVVEAHGGVITYDDAPGGGAVFTIKIPRTPGA